MARTAESYRGARRNAVRETRTMRYWRAGPHYSLSHKTLREHPVLHPQTHLPVFDEKTKKPVTEWRPFVAIQIIHQSYAQTMRAQ